MYGKVNAGKPVKIIEKYYIPLVISVSIYPGTIAFTRIPEVPNSAARARVNPRGRRGGKR